MLLLIFQSTNCSITVIFPCQEWEAYLSLGTQQCLLEGQWKSEWQKPAKRKIKAIPASCNAVLGIPSDFSFSCVWNWNFSKRWHSSLQSFLLLQPKQLGGMGKRKKEGVKMGLNIEGEEGRRERSSIKCNWIVPEQSLQRKRALKCRKSV